MQNPMMGDLIVVGLCHLRTPFCTSEQFVGRLCNVFLISYVREFLLNGTQIPSC